MSGALLTVVVAYLLLVAALGLISAVGLPCGPALRTGLIVAEVLLIAQVVIDVATILGGHRPEDGATHAGYAVVSVLLIPLLAVRAGRDRTGHVISTIVLAATAVVTVRLHATWATR